VSLAEREVENAMFMRTLEQRRQSLGFTQERMAKRHGYSVRQYQYFLDGTQTLSVEAMSRIARAEKCEELALAAIASLESNPFAPVMLQVDTHPTHVYRVAMVELKEALAALDEIDPCKQLTRQKAEWIGGQLMDLKTVVAYAIGALCRASNLDAWELAQEYVAKMEARGFKQREEVAA
jgi:transcriptional regulator with XRE-family HTH domain